MVLRPLMTAGVVLTTNSIYGDLPVKRIN